jgi:hypothetical protein
MLAGEYASGRAKGQRIGARRVVPGPAEGGVERGAKEATPEAMHDCGTSRDYIKCELVTQFCNTFIIAV